MSKTDQDNASRPVTVDTLRKMKLRGEKFAVLTVYDASFAAILERAGVEVMLVGDSLGMVIQGHDTTVPVTMDQMIYHTANVARVRRQALLMADLPFASFADPVRALDNAARLMQEGGAQMVKIEGGGHVINVVEQLASQGIPVCGHLGLQPQAVHKLGGYRVQGRDPQDADRMLKDAKALEEAGADIVLLESVPAALAQRITEALSVPTIGIGAGPDCDGQVLVLYDVLGISFGTRPRFAKDFLQTLGADEPPNVEAAIRHYVSAVKQGRFPGPEHTFS
jgi:3-methyl-2-oxobutanoate hydroxymethyltransferase